MAELIDSPLEENTETQEQEQLPLDHDLVVEEPEEETTPSEDDNLPEKYKGKSVAELARMHEEAQQALSRQGNEVGELRKVFDEYIQSTIQSQPEPVEEPIDFLLEPEKAVQRAIDNHPKIKQAEAVVGQVARQQNVARLQSDFPDLQATLGDSRFQEWVSKSQIRQGLYQKADKDFDYESAAELLNNWKDLNVAVERTKEVEKVAQKSEVRKANTGDTRSAPVKARKKVYRRSDIINLMKTDPSRYEALQPEIMEAYKDGRVK